MKRIRLTDQPITEEKRRRGNPNWVKGMSRPEGSGRVKGQPNKIVATIKEAVMVAAGQIGDAWEPGTGLVGYMKKLEQRKPEAFARLVAMMLPLTIRADTEHSFKQIDASTPPRDAVQQYLDTLRAPPDALPAPKLIEHAPRSRAVNGNGRAH